MPLIPNFIEKTIVLQLNQAPGPLFDLFGAIGFQAIQTALNLDVFEVLKNGPLPTKEIALKIKADERGTMMLLNALQALGYVHCRGDHYANTAMTNRWMLRSTNASFADGFGYWGTVLTQLWPYLEESIRLGRPSIDLYQWMEEHPQPLHDFQFLTMAWARHAVGEIMTRVKLPKGASTLLDVGGGHGLYSIAFCRQYSHLSATVFDLPGAIEVAKEVVSNENMRERIELQAGDFWKDDLGKGYDVILLFNIFHAFQPDQNKELIRKAAEALNPNGGILAVMDQFSGRAFTPIAESFAKILGLNFFHLMGGQLYPWQEVKSWLNFTGFNRPRRFELLLAPGSSLVLAKR